MSSSLQGDSVPHSSKSLLSVLLSTVVAIVVPVSDILPSIAVSVLRDSVVVENVAFMGNSDIGGVEVFNVTFSLSREVGSNEVISVNVGSSVVVVVVRVISVK